MAPVASDLTEFVRDLQWSGSAPNSFNIWKDRYLAHLKAHSALLVQREEDLSEAMTRTSQEELTYILLSPPVLWAMTQEQDDESTIREMRLEFGRRAEATEHRAGPGKSYPDVDSPLAGITIDFDSVFQFPGTFQSLRPAPEAWRDIVCQRLSAAFAELKRSSPRAFSFVKELTLRIAIRLQPERERFTLFGSFTEYPGLMLIINPWQTPLDTAKAIDKVVHENIHHAIAMFESVHHNLTPGASDALAHRSPWTGNFLTCHQFVEACFVWSGLYHMWLNWPAESTVRVERSRQLCRIALKGFKAHPADLLINAVGRNFLPKDTVEALVTLQQEANDLNSKAAA